MTKEKKRILISTILIAISIAFVAYGHISVNKITDTFVGIRKLDSMLLLDLVRDNWDGINSISEEKKKALKESLDPDLAGTDILFMGRMSIIFIYIIGAGLAIDRLVVITNALKSIRYNKANPADAKKQRG